MPGRVTSCLTARKRHYIDRAISHYSWSLHDAESRHCARPRLRRQSLPTNAMKWLLVSLLCLPCTGCGLAAAPGGQIRALSAAERQRAASFAEFPAYRQRYATSQQTMDTAISALRTRLRGQLAAQSPDTARLASVDTVMERVMGARERTLLASVPNLLEGHFVRLRDTEQAAMAAPRVPGSPPLAPAGTWLDTFHRDMQSILLAELDIRLEPIEGLIAALASVHPGENVSEPGQHDSLPR